VGITFQATLAKSSERANVENGAMGVGSNAGAGAAGRVAIKQSAKQERAQSAPSVTNESAASAPVPLVDQKPAPEQDSLGGHSGDRAGDGAAGSATPVAMDLQFLNASPDLSRQIAEPAVAGAAELTAITARAEDADADGDRGADGTALADAQTAANAAGKTIQLGTEVVPQASGETFELQMELPVPAASAVKADLVQPAGKAMQKSVVDAGGSKNSDLTNAMDAGKADSGKANAADAVGAEAGASSHGAQSNGQSMQHAQADGSQAAVVMQKVGDSGAAQVQAVPMHPVSHDAATTPGSPPDGTHPGVERGDVGTSPLDGDEQTPTSGINTAKLIQTMSETEMRIGMHSAEFGNISIRTSVSQQQVLAQISLDHIDLSQVISGHISLMQTKLGNDYGLQTLIHVNHQGASSSGQQDSAPGEQRAFAQSVRPESTAVPAELDVGISAGAQASAGHGYRLDIRA
jgi:hypothetical protein